MPIGSEQSCEVVAFARGQRSPGLSMAPKLYRQRQQSASYRANPESSGECRLTINTGHSVGAGQRQNPRRGPTRFDAGMHMPIQVALVALQAFQVAFLFLHDWIPLGRLTNRNAIAEADSFLRRVWTTLLSGLPFAIGLAFSLRTVEGQFPGWLMIWLWVSYGLLFAGELRAWWLPYLLWNEPARAARYRTRFSGTLRFLPERHGIAPDAIHTVLHASTVATLLLLTTYV